MFEKGFSAVTGSLAPAIGIIVSFQDQLDAHLRTTSLLVGLLVGLIGLFNVLKK